MYMDVDYYDILDEIGPDRLEDPTTTFTYIFEYCIKPTVYEASLHTGRLFLCCLIFRVIAQHCDIPIIWKHVASTVLGLYIMYHYFNEWVIHIVFMVILFYILIRVIANAKGMLILVLTFAFLVGNELIIQNDYTKIRGAEMVLGMKFISIAFDIQPSLHTHTKRLSNKMPSIVEFLGYSFFVGTCIFGPWISYIEYSNIFCTKDTNYKSLLKVVRSFIFSLVFFIMSMCFVEWLIQDNSHSWLLVYRDALLFRCGHYCVSFLSDTTISLAGYSSLDSICQPQHIELPRSLNQVVVHWNASMHKWLKYYVFRTWTEFGGFVSVLTTYIVSALMHGLNYRLAGVLISLGFYTYVEYSIRFKLANKWNACIMARSCPIPCHTHKYTGRMLFVTLFNCFCSILSVFHLAYLGVIIDTTSPESVSFSNAFDKWYELSFISHWIAIFTFLLYLIIK